MTTKFCCSCPQGHGGAFVDLEGPGGRAVLVPRFNTLCAFRVPRWHSVEPVAAGAPRARMSIFGWFLSPGKFYDLDGGGGGW